MQMGWSTARTQNAVRTQFANEVNFATLFLRQSVSILAKYSDNVQANAQYPFCSIF